MLPEIQRKFILFQRPTLGWGLPGEMLFRQEGTRDLILRAKRAVKRSHFPCPTGTAGLPGTMLLTIT